MNSKIFVAYFANSYKNRFNKSYPISYKKDCGIFKNLLQLYAPEDIYAFIDSYFLDSDPFLGQIGFKLEGLRSKIPSYINKMQRKLPNNFDNFEVLFGH